MAGVRTFLCPKNGAAAINRKSWLHVRLSPFVINLGGAVLVTERKNFAGFQEQNYPAAQQWTNRQHLLNTASRNQTELASATTGGIANKITGVNFGGFTASGSLWVNQVLIKAHNYIAFTGSSAGDTTVRLIVAYRGERIAIIDGAGTYVGDTTPIASSGQADIFEALRERIAPRRFYLTVAEVATAIEECEVLVGVFEGANAHRATTWYGGPVDIEIKHWDIEPEHQGGFEFEIDGEDGTFTSGLYWKTNKIGLSQENRTHYFLPPGAMDASSLGAAAHATKRWIRFREWNQWNNPTGWAGPVEIDLMSESMSRLAVEPRQKPITLVEIEAVIYLEAHLWDRHEWAAGSTYKIALTRDQFPISEFVPIDIEIEGVRQKATRQNRIQDVENNANSFIFDEWGAGQTGQAQDPGWLYYRPSTALHPAGMDSFRSVGIGLVVRVGLANQAVVTGETEDVPYLPLVLKAPSINDQVTGFSQGRGATPSGDLQLANVRVQGYDVNEDGIEVTSNDIAWTGTAKPTVDLWTTVEWAKNAPLWNRLCALQNPLSTPVGMHFHKRPIAVKLLPPGAPYSDALEVFRGEVGLNGAKLQGNTITLKTYGWQIQAKDHSFSKRKITRTEYPNAPDSSVGRNYQQAWGAGHTRAEALVVETVTAAILTTGDNWSAVSQLYMDGEVYPETWSFDAAKQEITLTGASALTHIGENHNWEFDGDGEAIEQWDLSVTATTRAGALMRRFIRELGILDADVLTDYFKLIDDPASVDEWPLAMIEATVRCVFPRETPVLTGLRILEDTRAVHVRRRPDGKVDNVPMYPTELDEHSILIDRWDTAGSLPFGVDTSRMGDTEVIEYMGYADVYEPITEAPAPTYLTKGRWGVEGDLRLTTMFSHAAGVAARRGYEVLNEPIWGGDLPILLKAANVWPGTVVLANLPVGPTPDGEIIWGKFKVEEVSSETADGLLLLSCRYVGKAKLWQRPETAVSERYAL